MSKSLGNHIGVSMDAFDMYSKVMSIPDANMKEWYTLLTALPMDEVERLCTKMHPKMAKDRLAREIVSGFHPGHADAAAAEWDKVISKGQMGEHVAELIASALSSLVDLLLQTKVAPSKSEAKRLIEQGGVELDGAKITDIKTVVKVTDGMILKVGKKNKFFKLKPK